MQKQLNKEQCFEQLLLGKAVESESWLDRIRQEALARAEALNFPSARDEDWRFTDLSSLFLHGFQSVDAYAKLTPGDIARYSIPGAIRLVFVDGCYSAELSDLEKAGSSVTVASLSDRLGDQMVETNFGRYAPYKTNTFVALNTNFFEDGAWIHVVKEETAPIHLLHVATKRETPTAIYPRCLVLMEPCSRATMVEDYVNLDGGIYFTNAVTEVVLKSDAKLQHVRLQREDHSAFHVGHSSVCSGRDSVYTAVSIALGSRLSRHTLHVTQTGEGAEILLDGLALISGRQIADTHTQVDHAVPNGRSVQLHKCIADGASHAVFSGKILVHPGATGTDSAQSSRNLLLSDKAHIDTQPQLEIFNDDVICKHGATIGQIDQDALFFLKSRGLTEERARNLLIHAFAAEIIDKISVQSLLESLDRTIIECFNGDRTSGVRI
jgi:Fe-S cluster assembly protein SufD